MLEKTKPFVSFIHRLSFVPNPWRVDTLGSIITLLYIFNSSLLAPSQSDKARLCIQGLLG